MPSVHAPLRAALSNPVVPVHRGQNGAKTGNPRVHCGNTPCSLGQKDAHDPDVGADERPDVRVDTGARRA